ncbi:putative GTP-binding protein [Smittium mucronatum]|uniref:Putative GTP-binding protein n=1 Tax=Smittium mucronatum TaxID=133383 RepID=A0A1R0GWR3_9FUNG|nr:putative GTP-binding protein [Smittium mucronatum]
MIDVAGLVPGASEGRGLGNKFLDDLRHADVLIHIVDSSGTTDENGKATKGYDPTNDIEWLRSEIHAWIFNNLNKKWDAIVRRHIATKSTSANTFQTQLSGYGTSKEIIVESLGGDYGKTPLKDWTSDFLYDFVFKFIDVRFPTVIALNKIDHPDSDTNITRIIKYYTSANKKSMSNNPSEESKDKIMVHGVDPDRIVLTSALSECYLKLLAKQNYIIYNTGDEDFISLEDDPSLSDRLVSFDNNVADELERIRDLVLYRYFSTGTQQAIIKAVETLNMIPVYPVKKIPTILPNSSPEDFSKVNGEKSIFRDVILVKSGTTVKQFAEILGDDFAKNFNGAESIGGLQLGEDDVIVPGKNNVISIKTKYSSIKTSSKAPTKPSN